MSTNNGSKIKLFISYSHEDAKHKADMQKALSKLERDGCLTIWSDRDILPGQSIHEETRGKIEEADIIVFLLSQNFVHSDECTGEWEKACEVKATKLNLQLIPVILEECAWYDIDGMRDLNALPRDAKPVTSFNLPSDAWHQVYEGIKNLTEKLANDFIPEKEVQQRTYKTTKQVWKVWEVWERHFGSAQYGHDCCGATMRKAAYGDRNSGYGWEVDHIVPLSRGGSDASSNLRPLHWQNNDAKGDNLDGQWTCAVGGLTVETGRKEVTKMAMSERAKKVWENAFGPSAQSGMDAFGVEIRKAAYGDENSTYGWDIDHIVPRSEGGTSELTNLRPLNIPDNRGRHHQ